MSLIKGKTILVTGGTGSIGKSLVLDLLKLEPYIIRILDIDETDQFDFMQELNGTEYSSKVRFLLGDIRDKERLKRAVEDVDIIFHTAALKHVWACEYNPFEAVKTNIIGLQNILEVAIEEEVDDVIYTSSDKAVNPNNTLGASKLLGEKLVTAANFYKGWKKTKFSSVRFGNVIGSRGSVFPLFKKQIKNGGPVTITNTEMTRFMMPISHATELVLKSLELMQGGEIFIFKMPTVKLIEFAEIMIEELAPAYGYNKDDIQIKIIGNKPGEKMFEEIMTEAEAQRALETEDMYIILPELIEGLIDSNRYSYEDATPIRTKEYSSNNVDPIKRKDLKKLFYNEKLI